MIRGELRGDEPYLTLALTIPRLGLRGEVPFLVDTGATRTLVGVPDATRIGVDVQSDFTQSYAFEVYGIGGRASEYREVCSLEFLHDDGRVEDMEVLLNFATPSEFSDSQPSLLGRDVLGSFRLTYHLAVNLVSLE